MVVKKSGLKKRLAFYFAASFLLPAAVAFLLLYKYVVSEFGVEVRGRSAAVNGLIGRRIEATLERLSSSVNAIYSNPEFTAFLYSFRKGEEAYADWVELGSRLAAASGLDEVCIYNSDRRLLTSALRKERYGLIDDKAAAIREDSFFYSVVQTERGLRMLIMRPKTHPMPAGKSVLICTGLYFDEELISLSGLYAGTYIGLKLGGGDFIYYDKWLPARVGLRAADKGVKGELGLESENIRSLISSSKEYVQYDVFSTDSIEGIPIRVNLVYSIAPLNVLRQRLYFIVGLIIISGIVFSVIFGLMISKPFTLRLEQLLRAMRLAASGETKGIQLDFKTGDDFETISGTFNSLVNDIAELQKRLLEAERIRTWQDIARKMAHEIKNPLAPIRVSAETLIKAFQKKPQGFEKILNESTAVITEEVQRIRNIIDEFVAFARLPELRKSFGDINRAVEQASALFRNEEGIEINVRSEKIRAFFFDYDQISRVLHNLIKNAVEAVAGDGIVTIETSEILSYNRPVARVVISDNGPGMGDEVKDKLFTPYFTTKKDGTGLGLNICRRIILEHDGSFDIESKAGEGTKVIFTLPISGTGGKLEE